MRSRREDLVVVLDSPELGPARPVGVLTRWPGPVLSVGFQYARSWLDDLDHRFAIDPALPIGEELHIVPGRRLPGILADTAPDAWGEALMVRHAGHALDAWRFLTGVADTTRMGALRLRSGPDGRFIADREPPIPPFHRLRELQALARQFEERPDEVSSSRLALLVAPGSSLGGVRPKASFVDVDGALWIAKFPAATDRRDVGAWEQVYARLAEAAGIVVPRTDLLSIAGTRRTFATQRFDRVLDARRLYASALTLTGRTVSAGADYVDIAKAISDHGAAEHVRDDLHQLYRRMTFNVLAGNRDDHLRNHGFLRDRSGWRLAPAFDLNPAREAREHATAVNGVVVGPTASDVLDARTFFGLSEPAARSTIRQVAEAVSGWRQVASEAAISRREQDEVAVALTALGSASGF